MEQDHSNPLFYYFSLVYHMIIDHIIYYILLLVAMGLGYFLKDSISFILHKIENLYQFPLKFIISKRRKKIIAKYIELGKTKELIFIETQRNVDNLSDAEKRFVSLQYLYEFPSDIGFKAIFELILSESDIDVKTGLIHSMSDSIKEKKLLIFNK